MSENKGERQQSQVSPSSKESKEEEVASASAGEKSQQQAIKHHRLPLILPSITPSHQFISSPLSVSPTTIPSPHHPLDSSTVKRPRFSPNPTGQWKPVSSPSHQKLTLPTTNPPSSSDTASASASSPSNSPILSLPTSSDTATTKPETAHQQLRKGKYVSPVWKPHEMLWLARAWRNQYQGGSTSLEGADMDHVPGGTGRGKTRAEKDREVAEFLKGHGVNRDAKTAGTKWDNMLGEFRKVYEWERGGEREQVGKSYFRLSPYERKIHRLPASFDEEVFEELAQFMGSRIRSSSSSSSPSQYGGRGRTNTPLTFLASFGADEQQQQHTMRGSSLMMKALPPAPPLPPLREEDTSFSGRARQLILGSGMDQPYLQGARASLLGFDQSSSPLDIMAPSSSSRELRRIGRIRMTWEESVNLWADEEGEHHKGRVRLQGSNFLNADELTYFDESMVACAFESFTDGPLKGFSVDRFVAGQQLKVLGRRKPPSGSIERLQLPPAEPPTRSTPSWDIISDPTEYYMGCLRVPPLSLPSLYELSWYIQDPPPEEFRFPIRKDLYRDLPPGKELFATSSNDFLDSRSFTIDILSPLIRTPTVLTTPTSRDSYIGLWDDCINRLVARFCPVHMSLVRKPATPDQDLQDKWPNVTGFVKNLCLWRGEETDKLRGDVSQLDPSNSILEKLFWSYGDLPYILGYHAVGPVVTFCALSRALDNNSKIIRTDIYSLDLSVPSERIKALVPCWRISCILQLLAERSLSDNTTTRVRFSDFARVEHGPGQVAAEMTPRTTTRYYSSKEKRSSAKEVYDVLDQQVPYTERVMGWSEAELSITFTPRGFKAMPATAEELVEALKHVTKALVALHDLCFMHRDLSWEKVLRRCDKEEWVICGFEEMVTAPQINNPMGPAGAGAKRAPEMGRVSGVHGVKVDVWGVGYLVATSGLVGSGLVPKQLKELESRCLDQNPEKRPTAADCYHHLLQVGAVVVGDSYGG